jgi:hypothetical protein
MGVHSKRNIDTPLDFIVRQIHATRQIKDSTLLLLNLKEVYDRVEPA